MAKMSKLFITGIIGGLISVFLAANLVKLSSKSSNATAMFANNTTRLIELLIPIDGAVGPESLAFDPHEEGPYTGVSDGRVIKWHQKERKWIDFAFSTTRRNECEKPYYDQYNMEHICGRPLGLCFSQTTGDLYIADAHKGLLVVSPGGGSVTSIATEVEGVPFKFLNALDIDQKTGAVYFTDSSSRFDRRNHMSVILSGDATGRVMKYDPKTMGTSVLLDNMIHFPNGITVSKDGNFLLIVETTKCRILKYWLETSKAGTLEVFAELPGYPDNIKRSPRGGFWIGIYSRKQKVTEWIFSYPRIIDLLLKLPINIMRIHRHIAMLGGRGMGVRLSEDGQIMEIFEGSVKQRWRTISEVEEKDGKLWIGSVTEPFTGVFKV